MDKTHKLDMHTKDKSRENFEKLKALFPNAVTETVKDGKIVHAIDKDILMQEINAEVVEGKDERYQFTWPQKKQAVLLANAPTTKTLRPCREESVNFDIAKNLYIEGDNLEVLKLLQETYLGKVKMIYIDPPYNTGEDRIYLDNFESTIKIYKEKSNQLDENNNILVTNLESNGRFHTDWLNMMYPRLRLARDLLTDDGVIFISIDDNEVSNLKKICDEIFGEQNFETNFYIKVRHENRILREDINYQQCLEHILCYKKNEYKSHRIVKNEENSDELYCYNIITNDTPDQIEFIENYQVEIYKEGHWQLKKQQNGQFKEYQIRGSLITQKGSASEYYEKNLRDRKNLDGEGALYKVINMGIKGDGLGYRYIRQPFDFSNKNGFYYQGRPLEKKSAGLPYPNFYDFVKESNNLNSEGGVEYKGGKKPLDLIQLLFKIANINNSPNAIILDFFAGSATTGEAVINLNNSDNGNRQFILVQLPENLDLLCESNSRDTTQVKNLIKFLDKNNKPHLLTELGKIRLSKIKNCNFRVLKLDTTNMKDVYYTPAQYQRSLLDNLENNIKEDRSPEDLLFQVLLDLGVELSGTIASETIGGKTVFNVENNYCTACFDTDLTDAVITEIAKKQPVYAVFRDMSFNSDSVGANVEQIFTTYSPNTKITVL